MEGIATGGDAGAASTGRMPDSPLVDPTIRGGGPQKEHRAPWFVLVRPRAALNPRPASADTRGGPNPGPPASARDTALRVAARRGRAGTFPEVRTMSLVPQSRVGKIEFYEAHLPAWTTHAVPIGLGVPEVAALATAVANARAAYTAHVTALEAARAATQNFYDKVRHMHSAPGLGADMILKIRTKAQTANDPNVYVLAQIPPPATPGVTPPPGTPSDFAVGLLQDGSLQLKWKCGNPPGTVGTIYEVKRQIGGEGVFAFVGASGVKSFLDDTLPGGSAPVTYQITAVRSTARGNPAQFTVNFGMGGGGLAFATITGEGGANVKMAA